MREKELIELPQMHKNEIRHIVLSFLHKHKYQVFSTKKLFYVCGIPKESASVYNKLITELEKSSIVFMSEGSIKWNCEYFMAKCSVFGNRYYAYNDRDKYRISLPNEVKPLDGDCVISKIVDRPMLEAELVEISARTDKYIIGTLTTKNGISFVIPDDKNRYFFDIYIGNNQPTNALGYAKVEVKINRYETKRNPCGTITRYIRNVLTEAEKNVASVLAKHDIRRNFDEEVMADAAKIKDRISRSNYPAPNNFTNRIMIDDRNVCMITDGETSDLAFSWKRLSECDVEYQLDIYTPDVAEVVQEGCKIDKAAYNRCLEVRTHGKTVPIFPSELLENKILFREGKKRMAVGCRLSFDEDMRFSKVEYFEAIVVPCVVVSKNDLDLYAHSPTDDFELTYNKALDFILAMKSMICQDAYYAEMPLSESVDSYCRAYFDRYACNLMTVENIPIMYRSSDPISDADVGRFSSQSRAIMLTDDDLDRIFYSPPSIADVLKSVLNANIKKAFRVNFESIIPIEEYCDVIKPNRRRGYVDCRVSSPTRSHPDLYNQRILKRFIKKTIYNENVFDKIRNTIEKDTERYNTAEYRIRQAIAECECTHNANMIKDLDSFPVIAYNITPSGVYVIGDNGVKGLLRFSEYELSDQVMRYKLDNGADGEIKIGDKLSAKFHWLDLKNKRIILQMA